MPFLLPSKSNFSQRVDLRSMIGLDGCRLDLGNVIEYSNDDLPPVPCTRERSKGSEASNTRTH